MRSAKVLHFPEASTRLTAQPRWLLERELYYKRVSEPSPPSKPVLCGLGYGLLIFSGMLALIYWRFFA